LTLTTLIAVALIAAPRPGDPAPRRELPKDLESAPWEELWVDQCKDKLTAAGQTEHYYFSQRNRLQSRKLRGHETIYCHVPQASVWTYGPTGVRYYGFSMFNCAMSLAMTRFERIAQEEAHRIFETKSETPIKAIRHLGTYNCRRLREKPDKQSQHSFGNAIDLASFYIRGVGTVDIQKHWTARYPYLEPRQEFLRSLVKRLRAEQVFTNVLDPTWDPAHTNHIHVDLAVLADGLPSPALARTLAMPIAEDDSPRDGGTTAITEPKPE